ncbi:MAG: hypothetical protein JW910_07765, partial [Anaerolineae bacterium]|nr:hypothetical protein [Anaerolineae bacterium]
LSRAQRQRLFFHSVGYLVNGLAWVVLNVILAAYLVPNVERWWQAAAFALLAGLCIVIGGTLLLSAARLIFPTVRVVDGSLERGGDIRRPCVKAGAVELRISARRWKRLPAALPGAYRVYYCERELLSAEPLNEDDRR